jgi:hypothetical protein
MSHFLFLRHKWPAVFEAASKAEAAVHADPRAGQQQVKLYAT